MDEVDKIRNEISSVDERIIEALANRRKLAEQIIKAKGLAGTPIRDFSREEQLLANLIAKGRSQGLDAHLVTRVFHEIIDDSIRSQQLHLLDYDKTGLNRVAFQGIEGADFFELDPGFQALLTDLLPEETHDSVFNSLHHCGRLVAGRWNDLAREANKPEHLPKIVKFDRAGNPVEQVDFGTHARHLRREVAEFGVLTDARNELHKFAIVYLLAHNGEGSVNCGLSCTDGLIRAIEAELATGRYIAPPDTWGSDLA